MNRARHPACRTGNTASIQPLLPKADRAGTFLGVVWILGNIATVGLLGVSALEQPAHAETSNLPVTAADAHLPAE
ncbi:hypothetical protein [Streptomyces silvisoli]|uniref:MFS transporter n=1 Tax=Streptomyces silvisoli TaxID=3034235 RepID=A0ABT5ZRQ8_9ACTN|nr:hypothetical protein [Streptomyces silvisoli]MDF3292270.1 hypothetical protein [Streptomyces silvisoli]